MSLSFPSTKATGANVIGGGGEVYLGSYIAGGADSPSLRFLGGTKGGIELTIKRNMHKIVVDQYLGPLASFPIDEEVDLKATFSELYLQNVQEFLGNYGNTLTAGTPSDATGKLLIGEDTTRNVRQMVARGPSVPVYGSTKRRITQLFSCTVSAQGPMKTDKSNEMTMQATFHAFVDPTSISAGNAAVGQIFDA